MDVGNIDRLMLSIMTVYGSFFAQMALLFIIFGAISGDVPPVSFAFPMLLISFCVGVVAWAKAHLIIDWLDR